MTTKTSIRKAYKDLPKYENYLISNRHIAQAQSGIAQLAKKTHLNEKTLYRTLSKSDNPRLDTIWKLFSVLDFPPKVVTV